jgi:hypothetical protein
MMKRMGSGTIYFVEDLEFFATIIDFFHQTGISCS